MSKDSINTADKEIILTGNEAIEYIDFMEDLYVLKKDMRKVKNKIKEAKEKYFMGIANKYDIDVSVYSMSGRVLKQPNMMDIENIDFDQIRANDPHVLLSIEKDLSDKAEQFIQILKNLASKAVDEELKDSDFSDITKH